MFTKLMRTSKKSAQPLGRRTFFDTKDFRPILARVRKESWITALHIETEKHNHLSEKGLQLSVKHRVALQINAEEDNHPVIPAHDQPAYEIIKLQLLYGIAQTKWEDFTSELVPGVVEALNLNKFRYLWPGYNLAVANKSPLHQIEIAEWIGRMHFLQDMLLQGELCLTSFNIDKPASLKDQKKLKENFLKLLNNLKAGYFSYGDMQALHPGFTSSFLHLVSHYPDFGEVVRLASLATNFAATELPSSLNFEELRYAIDQIPSSRMEPTSFNNFVQLSKKPGMNHGALFFNGHNQWNQYTREDLRDIDHTDLMHYLENLYTDLILSEIMRVHPEQDTAKIQQAFVTLMAHSCSIRELHFLQKAWHDHSKELDALKPFLPSESIEAEKKYVYPFDSLSQEAIYQFYRINNLLPLRLKENTWQEMLTNFKPGMDAIAPVDTLAFSL